MFERTLEIIDIYNQMNIHVEEIKCDPTLRETMKGIAKERGCTITYTTIEQEDEISEREENHEIIRKEIIAGLGTKRYHK